MNTYIGIDLHKQTQTWVGIDEQQNKLFTKTFPSTPSGTEMAIHMAQKYGTTFITAIEPCCGWLWVVKQLRSSGIEVHISNPRKVRAIADSLQKTDENDAYMLARLLRTGMMEESTECNDEIRKLRSRVRERSFLVRLRSSVKCRLTSVITREGLHLVSGAPASKQRAASIVASDYEEWKRHSNFIKDIDAYITIFDDEFTQYAKTQKVTKLLMTIPGVGALSAVTLYAEIADFTRFPNANKISAYAGLVPTERSSGGTQRLGHITHAGSKHLRYILVEIAMRIRNTEKTKRLYDFYHNLKERSGPLKARVALARKMLVIAWTMVTHNEVFRSI
jgi:transposase